ncbi:hydrolase [Capnocytophaga canis]|uniref:hydrolase n=1 Tax=Capnocytophaga canis TaxID=1848903 RepID=UPI0015629DFA|nr:hydrolase [Capnocytophaga canis]
MNKQTLLVILLLISLGINVFFLFRAERNEIEFAEVPKVDSEQVATADGDRQSLLDSIRSLVIKNSDLQYFDLQYNNTAKDYFIEQGIDNPQELVMNQILKTNTVKGKHPLIRFAPKNESFQTNKIKILNHKWAICDFSDGRLWGELLIKYYINEDKTVELTVMDDLLYPEEGRD